MDELIIEILRCVLLAAQSDIALFVKPDFRGVEVLNQHPLANVKFPVFYQKRVLYIFLNYVLGFLSDNVVHDFSELVEKSDPASST